MEMRDSIINSTDKICRVESRYGTVKNPKRDVLNPRVWDHSYLDSASLPNFDVRYYYCTSIVDRRVVSNF